MKRLKSGERKAAATDALQRMRCNGQAFYQRPGFQSGKTGKRRAFTLIEMVMAITACALILVAIYGVFTRAIRLRDDATLRIREVRLGARAATVLRNDLRNALVSGGTLAASLRGSQEAPDSSFPGYLQLTTTTAADRGDELFGDIQQVEYFIVNDANASDRKSGTLVRAVDRDLLAPVRGEPLEERLLSGVESMDVSFFDGQGWVDTWEITDEEKTLPEGIRVIIRRGASTDTDRAQPPIEVLIPWTTQPAIETPVAAAPAGSPTPPAGGSS